jgi:hypothetical protein
MATFAIPLEVVPEGRNVIKASAAKGSVFEFIFKQKRRNP